MTLQDHTAPEYPVKVSRTEAYQVAFEMFLDEAATRPQSLAGKTFYCDVMDSLGIRKLALTEGAGIWHPADNAVVVSLTTAQMRSLSVGNYSALLYEKYGSEQENYVLIKLVVV